MLGDLPGEIVEKILCKLPVKEVIRATTLEKSLHSLIHSKSFVSLYNNETLISESPNPPLIFIRFVDRSGSVRCSLRRDNRGLDEFLPVRFPLGADCKEVGFCNSLVCLFDCRGKQLILWNPLLDKTLTLPKSIHDLDLNCFFGLGFVHETSDYKVLVIDQNRRAQLYSLQLNCGTVVSGSPLDFRCDGVVHPACVRSSLYWVSAKDKSVKSVVVAFDLKNQAFGEISLPDAWESVANLYVRAFGESGIAVVGDGEDLGVPRMGRRRSDDCLTQVMDVNEKRWKFHSAVSTPRSGRMWVMGFSKEGRAIIDRGRYLTIAVHEDRRLRNKIEQGESGAGFVFNYVSNLALLA